MHRCRDHGLHPRRGHRLDVFTGVVHVPLSLEVAREGFREQFERRQPLHAGHAVPSRHDQAHRRAVWFREWRTGHMRSHQRIGVHGNMQWHRALKAHVGRVAFTVGITARPMIGGAGQHFHRAITHTGTFENHAERDTRPHGGAHGPKPQGSPGGTGFMPKRPLPAHSRVMTTAC